MNQNVFLEKNLFKCICVQTVLLGIPQICFQTSLIIIIIIQTAVNYSSNDALFLLLLCTFLCLPPVIRPT